MVSRRTSIITFETVREIGLALPGVDLGTAFGHPALKANGRVLATVASNKSAEPDSIYVSLGIPERDELVAADPDVFYLTPHYVPWPCVVARLTQIHKDMLKDLLAMSLQYCLSKPAAKRKKPAAKTRTVKRSRRS